MAHLVCLTTIKYGAKSQDPKSLQHVRSHNPLAGSKQERLVREIRTLGAMRRELEIGLRID